MPDSHRLASQDAAEARDPRRNMNEADPVSETALALLFSNQHFALPNFQRSRVEHQTSRRSA